MFSWVDNPFELYRQSCRKELHKRWPSKWNCWLCKSKFDSTFFTVKRTTAAAMTKKGTRFCVGINGSFICRKKSSFPLETDRKWYEKHAHTPVTGFIRCSPILTDFASKSGRIGSKCSSKSIESYDFVIVDYTETMENRIQQYYPIILQCRLTSFPEFNK